MKKMINTFIIGLFLFAMSSCNQDIDTSKQPAETTNFVETVINPSILEGDIVCRVDGNNNTIVSTRYEDVVYKNFRAKHIDSSSKYMYGWVYQAKSDSDQFFNEIVRIDMESKKVKILLKNKKGEYYRLYSCNDDKMLICKVKTKNIWAAGGQFAEYDISANRIRKIDLALPSKEKNIDITGADFYKKGYLLKVYSGLVWVNHDGKQIKEFNTDAAFSDAGSHGIFVSPDEKLVKYAVGKTPSSADIYDLENEELVYTTRTGIDGWLFPKSDAAFRDVKGITWIQWSKTGRGFYYTDFPGKGNSSIQLKSLQMD